MIANAGGAIIAQDEESSVVWGMPGAVSQAGLANKVLPLPELAAEINRLVGFKSAVPAVPAGVPVPACAP